MFKLKEKYLIVSTFNELLPGGLIVETTDEECGEQFSLGGFSVNTFKVKTEQGDVFCFDGSPSKLKEIFLHVDDDFVDVFVVVVRFGQSLIDAVVC